jgi:hypothetical protein
MSNRADNDDGEIFQHEQRRHIRNFGVKISWKAAPWKYARRWKDNININPWESGCEGGMYIDGIGSRSGPLMAICISRAEHLVSELV